MLGDATLRITRLIVNEPDRGAGFMNFAPRVMIHQDDIAATGLVQPASRLTYRMAVAGEDRPVRAFVAWAADEVKKPGVRGVRVESLESGRPEMRQTLDRAEKFLNLVALLAALLSAVAVALAARGFATSHLDDCAMLRVLGESQRTIALSYALEFALIGLFASSLGVAIGYGVHHVFVVLLAGLVDSALPPASLWPVAFGLGMGAHTAGRLWPAAGAATGAGAAAARDPARRGQPETGVTGGAGAGRGRLCRLVAGRQLAT